MQIIAVTIQYKQIGKRKLNYPCRGTYHKIHGENNKLGNYTTNLTLKEAASIAEQKEPTN